MTSTSGETYLASDTANLSSHQSTIYRHKKFQLRSTIADGVTRGDSGDEQKFSLAPRVQVTLLSTSVPQAVPVVSEQPSSEVPAQVTATLSPARGQYQCSYCGNFFSKPSVLDKHIRSHTNERPYSCVACRYSFKTKSNFVKHCKTRKHTVRCEGEQNQESCDEEEVDEQQFDAGSESDSAGEIDEVSSEMGDVSRLSNVSNSDLVYTSVSSNQVSKRVVGLTHSIDNIIGRKESRVRANCHLSRFHERPEDEHVEAQSNGSTLNGVVRHIDKVIQLNEAHLSVTRRALDNFGRHTNTLVRERAAVRRSSISSASSTATLEANEDHLKEQLPVDLFQPRPSVLMRSHSLTTDVGHVLKRRLLSVADAVNHAGGVLDSSPAGCANSSTPSIDDSDHTPLKKIRRCSSDTTNSRVLKCFTGGEMLMMPEKDRDRQSSLSARFPDHSSSDDRLFPSLHNPLVLTIKSNLNSGGKMVEVGAGHGNGATDGERHDTDSALASAQLSRSQVGKYCMSTSASPIVQCPSWFPFGLPSSHSCFSTVDTQSTASPASSLRLSCRDGPIGFTSKSLPVSIAFYKASCSNYIATDPGGNFPRSGRRSTLPQSSSHNMIKSHDKRRKLSLKIPAPSLNASDHSLSMTSGNSLSRATYSQKCPESVTVPRDRLHSVDTLLLRKLKNKLILANDSAISFMKPESYCNVGSENTSDFHDAASGFDRNHYADDDEGIGTDARMSTSLSSSSSENISPDLGFSSGTISQMDCPLSSTSTIIPPCHMLRRVSPLTVTVRSESVPFSSQVHVLCSPDTPRPLKTIRERYIDGRCYTRIRLKSSTRLYFCCMFQTQPNYVEQPPERRQVSMYSEWRHSVPSSSSALVERALSFARFSSSGESRAALGEGERGGTRCYCWENACSPRMLYTRSAYMQSGCTHSLSTIVGRKWPAQLNGAVSPTPLSDTNPAVPSSISSEQAPVSCPDPKPASISCPGNQLLHDSNRLKESLGTGYSCIPVVLQDMSTRDSDNVAVANDDDSNTSREEGQKCPIDLCTRRHSPANARDSPVLRVLNCTEELSRLYANLGSVGPKLGPAVSLSTAPQCDTGSVSTAGPAGESLQAGEAPESTSTPLSSTSTPTTTITTTEVSETPSTESLSLDSGSSCTIASSVPLLSTGGESTNSVLGSPRKRTMRAVLDDIFKQVRSERVGAGVHTATPPTATTAAVVTYCASSTTPLPLPLSTAKSSKPAKTTVTCVAGIVLHPNVTAGKPGLPLTRPPPESDPPLHHQQQQQQQQSASLFYSGDRPVCGVCGKRDFVNRDQLAAHARTHQMEQRSHRCAVCEVGFRSEQQLAKHRRSAEHAQKSAMLERRGGSPHDRRIHECLFCMRGFHNAGTLHKHLRCKAHVTGLENAGWLPCGVYAQLEAAGSGGASHDSINVDSVWSNYCHLQELALTLLSERTCEMADWRVKFAAITSGRQLPPSYPYEIDAKLRGNTGNGRTRPVFPGDFLPLPLNGAL